MPYRIDNQPDSKGSGLFRYWKAILSIAFVAILAGCASIAIKDRSDRILGAGAPSVNIVGKSGSGDVVTIHSHGEMNGDNRIAATSLNTTEYRFVTEWGSLSILVPTALNELERQAYFLDSLHGAYGESLKKAVTEVINRLDKVNSRQTNIRILFASEGSGYVISDRSSTANETLDVSFVALVSSPSRELGILGPWISAARVIGHEMLHIEHFLRGINKTVRSPNGEASAEMMAWCAHSDLVANLGLHGEKERMSLGEQEFVEAAFPRITEGIFAPEIEAIDQGQDMAFIGMLLARAVVFTQAEDGHIDLASPQVRKFLSDRCDTLPSSIPDYINGEW